MSSLNSYNTDDDAAVCSSMFSRNVELTISKHFVYFYCVSVSSISKPLLTLVGDARNTSRRPTESR